MVNQEQGREEGMENFLSRNRRIRGNSPDPSSPIVNGNNIIPHLALSLKSRECSAMAFKHIFDQIRLQKSSSSASSYHEHAGASPPLAPSGPSHIGLVENTPNHQLCLPPEGYSNKSLANPLVSAGGEHARQEVSIAAPLASTSSATALRPQLNTAPQLTIFYSGTVSVYDGIPADKARAIMVLAGSGQSTANPACFEAISGPLSLGLMASAELPHARKASLARFLGKRKDMCGQTLTDANDLKE